MHTSHLKINPKCLFTSSNAHAMVVHMKNLIDDIRDKIIDSPLTNTELARCSGVGRSQLSQLVGGYKGLSVEKLEAVAACLGYEVRLMKIKKARR